MKLLSAALLMFALPASAQMYKCVDAQGKTNYSDQPGAGCKAVDIRSSTPSAAQPAARREDFATQDAALRRRQLDRERAAASERQALEEQCARVRQEQGVLASGIRIARLNERGERVFMEDDAREKRLAELAQELRGCP